MRQLKPEEVRLRSDPAVLGFDVTHDGHLAGGLLGQDRAESALRFGLGVKEAGFNIVVAGQRGTGKTTAVRELLQTVVQGSPVPPDWCYVYNFGDPLRPLAVGLPAGQGRKFALAVESAVKQLLEQLGPTFENEDYTSRREAVSGRLEQLRDQVFTQLAVRAQAAGFLLQGGPMGFFLVPLAGGKPIPDEELAAMPQEQRNDLFKRRDAVMEEGRVAMRDLRQKERTAADQVAELDHQMAAQLVGRVLDDLLEMYAAYPSAADYLRQVEEDLVTTVGILRNPPPVPEGASRPTWPPPGLLRRYEVNLVVDNSRLSAAPIVFEQHPTPTNLLGRVEREAQFGALVTDFTMIRTGSLHQANGGYLILDIDDLAGYPLSWAGLKRAIRDHQAAVEEIGERTGFFETKSLRPEPIPWDAKVILIGTPDVLALIRATDPELAEFFKVKADFDSEVTRSPDVEAHFGRYVSTLCKRRRLRPFEAPAVSLVIEFASRLAEDQQRLSTRFGEISDVMVEATHWAELENAPTVTIGHVRRALDQRLYRSALVRDKLLESTTGGLLFIKADGTEVGTINGLTVLSDGEYAFGRPIRITATVGVGRREIIDIEREVQLAGPIFGKAMMIIAGFLTGRYAQDKLLAMTARLVFEQTYGGIEGDSASCAEICALISQLAGVPLRQGLAITGSADQFGRVQAIGGVNEKVEGFYDLCYTYGLTGDQGVIIPEANTRNLMLREDVVAAIAAGQFSVYAVSTVDEALELLSGIPAGTRTDAGWTPGSVNARADARLEALAASLRRTADTGSGE